jgi:hypothetical protein
MTEDNLEFNLSGEELEYLKQVASKDKLVASLLKFRESEQLYKVVICISRPMAEQLRACLTERLAAVGFAEDYSPNEQGQMLERLIDTFHVR